MVCAAIAGILLQIFSAIAKPLIRSTKKFAKPGCNKKCQAAFDFLKDSLRSVPVLAYPDTSNPYILYTGASDDYIGTCLCQEQDTQVEMKSNEPNEKPMHYLSHKPTSSQKKTGLN